MCLCVWTHGRCLLLRFSNAIPMQKLLPTAEGGTQPLPEGLLWLLLTGELPTKDQVKNLSADLMSRSAIPSHITMMLRSLPPGTHPMTQLSMGIMALQPDSVFAKQYSAGIAPFSLVPRKTHMHHHSKLFSTATWRVGTD